MSLAMRRGVSSEAEYIENASSKDQRYLRESSVLGDRALLFDELNEAWHECRKPNWDGHYSLPVTQDALRVMYRFLEALPLATRHPTIGADPDGHLTVEWYRSPRRLLSVSVSPDAELHFAALLGAERICGTVPFYEDIPTDPILNLVRRVYS